MKNIVPANGWCTMHKRPIGFQFKSGANPRTGITEYYLSGSFVVNDYALGADDLETYSGSFRYGQGYAGCRACGSKYVYQCGYCSTFNCYDGKAHAGLICPNCGKPSNVAATQDERIVRSQPAPRIQIILAMDVSSSMNERIRSGKTRLREMQDAAINDFVRGFADVEMAVVAFETKVRTVINFTKDKSAVERAINSLTSGGGTSSPLAHIRNNFTEFVSENPAVNRYIVVFTDGEWAGDGSGHISSAGRMRDTGLEILTIGCAGADKRFLDQVATPGANISVVGEDFGGAFATAVQKISQ